MSYRIKYTGEKKLINPIYVTDTYISDIDDDTWWEMLEIAEWQEKMSNLLDDFSRKHNWQWQAGINGRSGGYVVLSSITLLLWLSGDTDDCQSAAMRR